MINNDTKEVVGKRNANEKIVPASMTKVMTVLVAANHISPEQLDEKIEKFMRHQKALAKMSTQNLQIKLDLLTNGQ